MNDINPRDIREIVDEGLLALRLLTAMHPEDITLRAVIELQRYARAAQQQMETLRQDLLALEDDE